VQARLAELSPAWSSFHWPYNQTSVHHFAHDTSGWLLVEITILERKSVELGRKDSVRGGNLRYLGYNFSSAQEYRLHGEPPPHQPEPLAHSYQSDSCGRIAEVRFKTPARILDAKTDAHRVRAKFYLCALRLTVFNHIAERFLGDSK
jgi:hypothetical protein